MTEGLAVRRAGVGDLDEIVALRLALLREYRDSPLYTALRPDASERARELFYTQLLSPQEAIFLAERHGRVIGILRCVDTLGSPLMLPERFCYVSSVYVVPSERRRGALRALLATAERWCADRGITEMRLHNAVSSELAAVVWRGFGFEVVEEVRRRVLSTDQRAPTLGRTHAQVR